MCRWCHWCRWAEQASESVTVTLRLVALAVSTASQSWIIRSLFFGFDCSEQTLTAVLAHTTSNSAAVVRRGSTSSPWSVPLHQGSARDGWNPRRDRCRHRSRTARGPGSRPSHASSLMVRRRCAAYSGSARVYCEGGGSYRTLAEFAKTSSQRVARLTGACQARMGSVGIPPSHSTQPPSTYTRPDAAS